MAPPERRNERLQSREQLRERERLGEVVVAAGLQALDAIVHRVPGAQDQHRHLLALRAQLLDHRQAIELRQHDVHHGGVVAAVERLSERVGAGRCHIHGIARLAKTPRDEVGNHRIVFSDENATVRWMMAARCR